MENNSKPTLNEIEDFFTEGNDVKLPNVAPKDFSNIILNSSSLGENMVRIKMSEGWNFHIEFKSASREYAMTYEATVYNSKLGIVGQKHGIGNNLEDLIVSLFGVEEYNRLLHIIK